MLFDTIAVVGVGLIGGSVGLAAKRGAATRRVIGIGRNPATLAEARTLGAIDDASSELAAIRDADLVVFCTPVDQIARQALEAAPHGKPGCLFTDAGSTKAGIVRDLEAELTGVPFVGAHPLAGSEKSGVAHARANLFDGRVCVVTPTNRSDPGAVEKASLFWKSLGCSIHRMTPEEHDLALATTSHLPHLVAATLAAGLPAAWQPLTATGFRDTTRIAAGDPGLWAAIADENAAAIALALDGHARRIDRLRDAVAGRDRDAIRSLLTDAKRVRDALGS